MPTINKISFGTVTGVWGKALIRLADGTMRELKVGDSVQKGDVILTSQNGIVQISDEQGDVRQVAKAVPADELSRVVEALNRGDSEVAPGVGVGLGEGNELTPGLRVERIAETLTSLRSFGSSGVERVDVSTAKRATAPDGEQVQPLTVRSTAISAVEEGSAVSLGLAAPPRVTAGSTLTVGQVPLIGHIVKADGTLVTSGMSLAPAELAGLRYMPPSEYDGVAAVGTFSYTASDSGATTTGGTTINLTALNDAPTATSGTLASIEDTTLPVSLIGQDFDGVVTSVTVTSLPPGSALTLSDGVTPVTVGQVLTTAQASSLVFRSSPDFAGALDIGFIVTDNAGAVSAPARIQIGVMPVNDMPVAVANSAIAFEDTPIAGNVLANDRDVDGPALTVTQFTIGGSTYAAGAVATIAGVGTLGIGGDGNYVFTPAPNYSGPVPLATYTATDGWFDVSSTLTLSVVAADDLPVALDDNPIGVTEDTPYSGNLAGNDTPSGDGGNVWALATDATNGLSSSTPAAPSPTRPTPTSTAPTASATRSPTPTVMSPLRPCRSTSVPSTTCRLRSTTTRSASPKTPRTRATSRATTRRRVTAATCGRWRPAPPTEWSSSTRAAPSPTRPTPTSTAPTASATRSPTPTVMSPLRP